MAKVKFTSIVSEIRGKLRGDVFKGYKQGFLLGRKPKPPFSRSVKQAANRAYLIILIDRYNQLTNEQKNIWEVFSSILAPPISGQNAFVKINLPILSAHDSGYSVNLTPPPEPTPVFPPLDLIYWPNENGTHQIFWAPPEDFPSVASFWSARIPGFSFLNRERWQYVKSVSNDIPTCLIDDPFAIAVPIVYRARTLLPSGVTSFFSPRLRLEARSLNYFDRCESQHPDFDGNWASFLIASDRIEGNGAYWMRFEDYPYQYASFVYEFDTPVNWSNYSVLNFLMKCTRALPTNGIAEVRLISRRNGDIIPCVYNLILTANKWSYLSFDLPGISAVPGSFNIAQVSGIQFNIYNAYPEGEFTEIHLDHVHLDAGVSEYFPPPPPPPPTGWDLSTAVYDDKSFNVVSQASTPYKLFFKPDGTKMYVLDFTDKTIFQYSLGPPWDISTAVYDNKSFNVGSQAAFTFALFFKPDGTKMYVLAHVDKKVFQYSLGTPWVINSAVYDDIEFSVETQSDAPYALFFMPDGTKMYVLNFTNRTIYQYSLGTPWDISTAVYDDISFSVASQSLYPYAIFFKPDGTKMYLTDIMIQAVFQYSLATPWDISTAVYDNKSFNVGSQATYPSGLFFKPDGTKMYIDDLNSRYIYQYSVY